MKNNVLYYSVGPLLYCPANRISITDSLINERFGNRFSLALCLEDTIHDDHVEEAEQILISSLSQIFIQHEQKPFYLLNITLCVIRAEFRDDETGNNLNGLPKSFC